MYTIHIYNIYLIQTLWTNMCSPLTIRSQITVQLLMICWIIYSVPTFFSCLMLNMVIFCELNGIKYRDFNMLQSQQTQNICITFVRRPNVFDIGTTLYKCCKYVLCLLGYNSCDQHCSMGITLGLTNFCPPTVCKYERRDEK